MSDIADISVSDGTDVSDGTIRPSPDEAAETARVTLAALCALGTVPMEILCHVVMANVSHNRTTRIRRAVKTLTEVMVAKFVSAGTCEVGRMNGTMFVVGGGPSGRKTYGWSKPDTSVRLRDVTQARRTPGTLLSGGCRRVGTPYGTVIIPPAAEVFSTLSGFGEEVDVPALREALGMTPAKMRTALNLLVRRHMIFLRMRGDVWAVRAYHIGETGIICVPD